ncbi:hypothetical protein [Paenibacillus radicis (ex Xue et al. 2023)]|uniref:Uncharacterized protein n=1 Tax=Paenibacillus radicis (ex Xue et al. 2023) TaxID=2972489 RepID=A0ABT1YMD9_9BACL|nr:hypothetical protein [Paenibacillus radicis (ex Xue et al. 2023)]MCR8633905.1 hypothetical protein [Paenibacillus radicis (ex Xue et al. 2023)]
MKNISINKRTIKTDEQLQNCINADLEVEVWFVGTLDCKSKIIDFNDDVVALEEGKYLRSNCVLKIKGSHLRLVK